FANPDQARTLRRIGETKGEAFYRGEVAERIASCAKGGGGQMTTADPRAPAPHRPAGADPISVDYRELRLNEIPPNGQGLAALMALGILRHRNIGDLEPDCPDGLRVQS